MFSRGLKFSSQLTFLSPAPGNPVPSSGLHDTHIHVPPHPHSHQFLKEKNSNKKVLRTNNKNSKLKHRQSLEQPFLDNGPQAGELQWLLIIREMAMPEKYHLMCLYVGVCVNGGQNWTSNLFLHYSPPYFLRPTCSLKLELIAGLDWLAAGTPLSLPGVVGITTCAPRASWSTRLSRSTFPQAKRCCSQAVAQ